MLKIFRNQKRDACWKGQDLTGGFDFRHGLALAILVLVIYMLTRGLVRLARLSGGLAVRSYVLLRLPLNFGCL